MVAGDWANQSVERLATGGRRSRVRLAWAASMAQIHVGQSPSWSLSITSSLVMMIEVTLRDADVGDVEQLEAMNAQLIEDERYDSSLPHDELRRRMHGFITGEFRVILFETDDAGAAPVGYCVVDLSKSPPYLRHFFICRNHRRQGYGRAALAKLIEDLNVDDLDVEVMAWNEAGRAFWRGLGFRHRYDGLRWTLS